MLQKGFMLVLDRRKEKWGAVKSCLQKVQVLLGQINYELQYNSWYSWINHDCLGEDLPDLSHYLDFFFCSLHEDQKLESQQQRQLIQFEMIYNNDVTHK